MHVELAPHGVKVATLNPGSYRTVLMNECLKPNSPPDLVVIGNQILHRLRL
jgi:hypothetical protein